MVGGGDGSRDGCFSRRLGRLDVDCGPRSRLVGLSRMVEVSGLITGGDVRLGRVGFIWLCLFVGGVEMAGMVGDGRFAGWCSGRSVL